MRSSTWLCLTVFALLLALVGCASLPPQKQMAAPVTITARLEADTAIPLVLLKELNSGATAEGEPAPFAVAEDIRSPEGDVVIPKGTPVPAKVVWSRSEGTLSGLMNQPARLTVRFEPMTLAGESVTLTSEAGAPPDEPYAFTRGNTGKPETAPKLESAMERDDTRLALEKLARAYANEGRLPDDEATRSALQSLAEELELDSAKTLLKKPESLKSLDSTLANLLSGATPLTGELSLALNAVTELAGVVGSAGDRLGRILKGRTIRAYPGTRVTLVLSEPLERKIQRQPSLAE